MAEGVQFLSYVQEMRFGGMIIHFVGDFIIFMNIFEDDRFVRKKLI